MTPEDVKSLLTYDMYTDHPCHPRGGRFAATGPHRYLLANSEYSFSRSSAR